MRPPLRAFVFALAILASGCVVRSTNEPVVMSPRRPAASRHGGPPPPGPSTGPAPAPPPDAPRADPEASRQFMAGVAEPHMPLLPSDRPPGVTMAALENTARGEAAGMSPDGPVLLATLGEGQRASAPLLLPAGSCTTFLAHGGLGVVEVDLFVTTGLGPGTTIMAEDPTSGPIAVIGGRSDCFKNRLPLPMPAELQIRVRRGAGQIVVRSYRR